jgi:CDP-2,3-bis-(O-geranylgeranyl)-sn-glycerol synthase
MNLWSEIVSVFWIYLPAGVANMTPVVAAKIFPNWKISIDQFFQFKSVVFGSHKTIRGFITGTVAAAICYLLEHFFSVSQSNFFLLGALMGFSALVGDSIKSLIKRRYSILPGHPWFPFDQIDWIIGAIIFTYPFIHPKSIQIFLAISLGLILHLLIKIIGYLCRLETKYI